MKQHITIFKDIHDTDQPFHRPLGQILTRIKDGSSKELVSSIRKEKNKEVRQELKKKLPAICFSGKFNKRNDSSLIKHSGIICLDFDGYSDKNKMISDKEKISKDIHTLSVFVSPSGLGLKVLVQIPSQKDNHKDYFEGCANG